jgi:hypothetical protein
MNQKINMILSEVKEKSEKFRSEISELLQSGRLSLDQAAITLTGFYTVFDAISKKMDVVKKELFQESLKEKCDDFISESLGRMNLREKMNPRFGFLREIFAQMDTYAVCRGHFPSPEKRAHLFFTLIEKEKELGMFYGIGIGEILRKEFPRIDSERKGLLNDEQIGQIAVEILKMLSFLRPSTIKGILREVEALALYGSEINLKYLTQKELSKSAPSSF